MHDNFRFVNRIFIVHKKILHYAMLFTIISFIRALFALKLTFLKNNTAFRFLSLTVGKVIVVSPRNNSLVHCAKDKKMNFELYYEQYKPLIQKVMYKCKVYGNYDEFRHIAMIGLWEAIKTFDEKKGSLDSYVYFKMKHKIMKEMGRQNKNRERFIVTMDDELIFLLESRQMPEVKNSISLETIWQNLKPQERQLLFLYYGEQMGDAEIAQLFAMKTDTVKKRRQRLIKKLRELVI